MCKDGWAWKEKIQMGIKYINQFKYFQFIENFKNNLKILIYK